MRSIHALLFMIMLGVFALVGFKLGEIAAPYVWGRPHPVVVPADRWWI